MATEAAAGDTSGYRRQFLAMVARAKELSEQGPRLFKPEARAKETAADSSLALQASIRGVLGKTAELDSSTKWYFEVSV